MNLLATIHLLYELRYVLAAIVAVCVVTFAYTAWEAHR